MVRQIEELLLGHLLARVRRGHHVASGTPYPSPLKKEAMDKYARCAPSSGAGLLSAYEPARPDISIGNSRKTCPWPVWADDCAPPQSVVPCRLNVGSGLSAYTSCPCRDFLTPLRSASAKRRITTRRALETCTRTACKGPRSRPQRRRDRHGAERSHRTPRPSGIRSRWEESDAQAEPIRLLFDPRGARDLDPCALQVSGRRSTYCGGNSPKRSSPVVSHACV